MGQEVRLFLIILLLLCLMLGNGVNFLLIFDVFIRSLEYSGNR